MDQFLDPEHISFCLRNLFLAPQTDTKHHLLEPLQKRNWYEFILYISNMIILEVPTTYSVIEIYIKLMKYHTYRVFRNNWEKFELVAKPITDFRVISKYNWVLGESEKLFIFGGPYFPIANLRLIGITLIFEVNFEVKFWYLKFVTILQTGLQN